MARGTAIGEKAVSQANTKAFDTGYARIYGDRKPTRGRWVWDESRGKLVRAEEYRPPNMARHADIMVDRFYEGATIHDGERVRDIGSRRKHREYMREKNLTTMDDYKNTWAKAEEARNVRRTQLHMPSKTRREVLERKFWEINNARAK